MLIKEEYKELLNKYGISYNDLEEKELRGYRKKLDIREKHSITNRVADWENSNIDEEIVDLKDKLEEHKHQQLVIEEALEQLEKHNKSVLEVYFKEETSKEFKNSLYKNIFKELNERLSKHLLENMRISYEKDGYMFYVNIKVPNYEIRVIGSEGESSKGIALRQKNKISIIKPNKTTNNQVQVKELENSISFLEKYLEDFYLIDKSKLYWSFLCKKQRKNDTYFLDLHIREYVRTVDDLNRAKERVKKEKELTEEKVTESVRGIIRELQALGMDVELEERE